jgi:hypothetical protein
LLHRPGRSREIGDAITERGVGKAVPALPETGEVEPESTGPEDGESACNPHRCHRALATGEAMGIDRKGYRVALRQVEPARQAWALQTGKVRRFACVYGIEQLWAL